MVFLNHLSKDVVVSFFFRTLWRVLLIVWRIFLGLFGVAFVYFVLIQPLARGWWLRHELLTALDNAASVKVVEHSFITDKGFVDQNFKEVTYATVKLTPEQIQSLRETLPTRLDYSSFLMLASPLFSLRGTYFK